MASHATTEGTTGKPVVPFKTVNYLPQHPTSVKGTSNLTITNVRMDTARTLEPSRKKLSTIESQRIMSVFDDSIRRVKIVTALPFIMKNMERFRVSIGIELVDLIRQYFRIQSSYQEVRNQLDDLLQSRAKQTELIDAKNAVPTSASEQLDGSLEIKKSYNFFDDDDNDFDYNEEESEEEDDEEEEVDGLDEVEDKSTEVVDDKEEDKEQLAVVEDTVVAETTDEMPQTKEISIGSAKSSQGEVAANIDLIVKSASESSSHVSLIDYEPRIQEAIRNLGLVAQQVSHSCKNILRLFTLNPTAMNIINNDEECMRNESCRAIIENMIELREILMTKLLSTPEEEIERAAYLEDISRRETHNKIVIERLEKELNLAIQDRDEGIRKNNEIIRQLQTDLYQIEKFSDESIRRTRAEAEKQELSDSKNSDQRIQKLQTEIDTLQVQLNNLITEHREIEADLRAKKYKVENEVENWIQKYDQDLGERQDEYEEIELIYTEEKKQLMELEERFAALEKEYLAIMEERRIAREMSDRAQRELNRVVKAATTIQAFWRSFKVRKALNKKKKKNKGGKKGKGKGKGKGKKEE